MKANKACFVYVMKFQSGIFKIGISGDPYKRYKRIIEDTVFKEDLVDLRFIQTLDRVSARGLESKLHKKYNDYSLSLGIKFGGYTEFFNNTLPIEDVLKDLFKDRYLSSGYISPFLSIKEKIPLDLRISFRRYLKTSGLYKHPNTYGKEWLKILSCLFANIIISEDQYYSLPQVLRSVPICRKLQPILRKLKTEHFIYIRDLLEGYTLTPEFTKAGYRCLTNFVKLVYIKDGCGLPYLIGVISGCKRAPFYNELLDSFNDVLGFSDNCKIRKEK